MIEILLTICLITSPEHCKDERLSFFADSVTPRPCMRTGQIEIAKWTETHPTRRVARWSSGPAGRAANV